MIQAIETTYQGYRFRSRLEARWAIFFDALGIEWMYEYQGFEMPNGRRYLPDFYLPELDVWFEVKGAFPDRNEQDTFIHFTKTDHDKVLFVSFHDVDFTNITCWFAGKNVRNAMFVECTQCDHIGFIAVNSEYKFYMYRLRCEHKARVEKEGFWPLPTKVFNAIETARSARFEYGETPKVKRGRPNVHRS